MEEEINVQKQIEANTTERKSNIKNKEISLALEKGLEISSDFKLIKKADVIIICVPTPLDKNRNPDLSYVINCLDLMSHY